MLIVSKVAIELRTDWVKNRCWLSQTHPTGWIFETHNLLFPSDLAPWSFTVLFLFGKEHSQTFRDNSTRESVPFDQSDSWFSTNIDRLSILGVLRPLSSDNPYNYTKLWAGHGRRSDSWSYFSNRWNFSGAEWSRGPELFRLDRVPTPQWSRMVPFHPVISRVCFLRFSHILRGHRICVLDHCALWKSFQNSEQVDWATFEAIFANWVMSLFEAVKMKWFCLLNL